MNELKITVSKIDDDNFVGGASLNKESAILEYGTDYIQTLDAIVKAAKEKWFHCGKPMEKKK